MNAVVAADAVGAAGARPLVGVLLLYYPEYARNAIDRFRSLLADVSHRHALVLVLNGRVELPTDVHADGVIPGDNSVREFTGWEAGLRHARTAGLADDRTTWVFANDTFCHHNRFGPLTRYRFASVFRDVLGSPDQLKLAGERFQLGGVETIDGIPAPAWISTYLFAASASLMSSWERLTPERPLDTFFVDRGDGVLHFSSRLSSGLAAYLSRWLAGGSGPGGWKNLAGAPQADLASMRGKASAIVCEKYLSALALQRGASLVNAFPSPLWRHLRRLEPKPRPPR